MLNSIPIKNEKNRGSSKRRTNQNKTGHKKSEYMTIADVVTCTRNRL